MTENIKDCRWPWNRLYIHANGDIKPCCYATAPLGNILNGDDPDQIWDGAPMKELREYIKESRVHRVCAGSGCSFIRSEMPQGADFEKQVKYKNLPDGYVNHRTLMLAKMGQPDAMYNLGAVMLEKTRKSCKNYLDIIKNVKNFSIPLFLLHKAAIGGQANAAYTLAMMIYKRDRRLMKRIGYPGLRFYAVRAAEMGAKGANVLLGVMYLNGIGVRLDNKLAEIEFQKAADIGESMGFLMLGRLAASENRFEDAYRFFRLAERRGETEATELLAKLNYVPPVIQSDKAQTSPDGGTKALSKGLSAPITP